MLDGPQPGRGLVISVGELDEILAALRADGFSLLGPRLQGGAIVHAEISNVADLPAGWTESQEAGTYRLRERGDAALFGFSVAAQSFKQAFFSPRLRLLQIRRKDRSFEVDASRPAARKVALVGARSCDLAGIEVQDRTFLQGRFADPDYQERRADTFVIAVQCGQAGGTCFCVSMDTGPRARTGFDIALTELFEPHRFVAEAGTDRGAKMLARVGARDATDGELAEADAVVERTAGSMGRHMDTRDIRELLYENVEHPRWDDVASRCLSCTNCTLACPTCFCSTIEDTSDLEGENAERWRRWDSCFTMDHSYLHGGSVRASTRSRYRQWLTHKLASWIDQFGTSGCVGCGRCITWCPVGIDITEEVRAIRDTAGGKNGGEPV